MNIYAVEFFQVGQELENGGALIFVHGDPRYLSPCFTAIRLKEPSADLWLARLKQEHGMVIGKGLGEGADSLLRIGHYPVHSLDDLQQLAETLANYK